MLKSELEINENEVDRVLKEAISCCVEVEIGEVTRCLLSMFEHIHEAEAVKRAKRILGKESEEEIDKLLICVFMSEIATLTANFKGRGEKPGAEA